MSSRIARISLAVLMTYLFMSPIQSSVAQVPGIINYQGRVMMNGTNYDGLGQFKFAMMDGSGAVSYWSNGASTVSVPVSKGLYSVLLGDTTLANMAVIPAAVFTNSDVRLRVSFNGGSGLQQLTPDQRIGSAGYAMLSAGVISSDDIVGRRLNIGVSHTLQGPLSSIGGGASNVIPASSSNSVICGGGLNVISDNSPYCTLGGGYSNVVKEVGSVIVGGRWNTVASFGSSIVGGHHNSIEADTDTSVIAGGSRNVIKNQAGESFIGGGGNNVIDEYAYTSVIGGGINNHIYPYKAASVLCGGYGNSIDSIDSMLGGGRENNIQSDADCSTLNGGYQNTIQIYSYYAWLGGGRGNSIQTNSSFSTLCGGDGNSIQSGSYNSTLGGGQGNTIETGADHSTLGGGEGNSIQEFSFDATLGGGHGNKIQSSSQFSTLGGGYANNIQHLSGYSTLGGGFVCTIQSNTPYSTLVGGYKNTIQSSATHSTLGGGAGNTILNNALYATLGGGVSNLVSGPGAFVGGGGYDGATLNANTASGGGAVAVGGTQNIASGSRSTVAGGHNNSATNMYATVPGGAWNLAGGSGSFAAGRAAKALHDGAFVWCDDTGGGDLVSTNANSVSMRARGGYRLYSSTTGNGVVLTSGGGSWTTMSDRNMKENVAPINSRAVLEKVAGLSVATWQYKGQDVSVRHIGPMAQDFKAAFGVGESETGITTVDADGVALAAIKGLYEVVKEKDARISALERELRERSASQDRELQELKDQVRRLLKVSAHQRCNLPLSAWQAE